jgi:hypothetical protein
VVRLPARFQQPYKSTGDRLDQRLRSSGLAVSGSHVMQAGTCPGDFVTVKNLRQKATAGVPGSLEVERNH